MNNHTQEMTTPGDLHQLTILNYTHGQQQQQDDDDDPFIVSTELRSLLTFLFIGVGCTAVSVVGTVANVVNVYVFFQQGLKDSVTISLICLSASDICVNVCAFFMGLCIILQEAGVHTQTVNWNSIMEVGFAWPRAVFIEISSLITVYVCSERAVCVIIPHKVKSIFTPFRTKKCIAFFCVIMFVSYMPIFVTNRLAWEWNSATNTTTLQQVFGDDRRIIETVNNIFPGIILPIADFIIVTLCSQILIFGLLAAERFKQEATSTHRSEQNDHAQEHQNADGGASAKAHLGHRLSEKNRKAISVVVLVALVFIFCTIPRVTVIIMRRFIADLCSGCKYENVQWVIFAAVYFSEEINASANMFVYLVASSKYLTIFKSKFCHQSPMARQNTFDSHSGS